MPLPACSKGQGWVEADRSVEACKLHIMPLHNISEYGLCICALEILMPMLDALSRNVVLYSTCRSSQQGKPFLHQAIASVPQTCQAAKPGLSPNCLPYAVESAPANPKGLSSGLPAWHV